MYANFFWGEGLNLKFEIIKRRDFGLETDTIRLLLLYITSTLEPAIAPCWVFRQADFGGAGNFLLGTCTYFLQVFIIFFGCELIWYDNKILNVIVLI